MSMENKKSKSAELRSRMNHPIIDSDGHTVEFEPGFFDCMVRVAGREIADRFRKEWDRCNNAASIASLHNWYNLSADERRDQHATRSPWWALPMKNTLDHATSSLPKLLYERLDETGLDYTVLYPTAGLFAPHIDDAELRRAGCRGFNLFHSEIFREFSDRMAPVAVIPMHTPQEAIEELEHAVKELGYKAVMLAGHVVRPIPYVAHKAPELARFSYWIDNLCIDSAYDYDPVWAKCVELKVPPTFHSAAMGWGSRTTVSNYMYNHIGHFGAAGEALSKAMFFSGVTRRFPGLRCGFLEGGVGWATNLYADLVGHWKKRNFEGMDNYNPKNLNIELLLDLYERYGGKMVEGKLEQLGQRSASIVHGNKDDFQADDFASAGIKRPQDIKDLFVPNFFFGCEADDPMNATAFNSKLNPYGARLNAVLSSDIGHWDVPDITEVLEEAYELVEEKVITEDDFKDFTFTNPVKLWTDMNPSFFKGTVVEGAVDKFLKQGA
jgi:predicted TIM-barrel fold metal-dependent hydrolase